MSETGLTEVDLYGEAWAASPEAHEAIVLGRHLIESHGWTLESLGDAMPANSGSPEADLYELQEIHEREH